MDNESTIFNTANRGLAAALLLNDFEIIGSTLNEHGKPSVNFEKSERLMSVFKLWREKKLIGNLAEFNDCSFKVYQAMKGVGV